MTEVTIRAFQMSDWQDVATLYLLPNCRWGTLQMPYQSRDEIQQKLANSSPGMHRLVALTTDSQKVIGMVSLHTYRGRRVHVGALGMFVHDDYHNQGIGAKLLDAILDLAENWLNLKRLELEVYVDNFSAIHLYEKYGFMIEGTLRKYAFRDGNYVDAYTMAKVRD